MGRRKMEQERERKTQKEGIFGGYSPGKLRFDPEGARQVERIRIVRDLGKRGRRQTSWIGTRRIARRESRTRDDGYRSRSSKMKLGKLRFFPTRCPISIEKIKGNLDRLQPARDQIYNRPLELPLYDLDTLSRCSFLAPSKQRVPLWRSFVHPGCNPWLTARIYCRGLSHATRSSKIRLEIPKRSISFDIRRGSEL